MEAGAGGSGFFFEDATKRLNKLFDVAGNECRAVFPSGGDDRRPAPQRPAGRTIQESIKKRFLQMCWMGDDDRMKIKALERMPLMEYFLLLDKKLVDVQKANKPNGTVEKRKTK